MNTHVKEKQLNYHTSRNGDTENLDKNKSFNSLASSFLPKTQPINIVNLNKQDEINQEDKVLNLLFLDFF